MATSQIYFSELKVGRYRQTVQTRLLRFWEAQNVKKGGELIVFHMMFIDSMREGSLYEFSAFDVARSNLIPVRESRVCLSVIDGLAKFLNEKFAASGVEPKVVVPTNINPKLVGACLLGISISYVGGDEHPGDNMPVL
ncbi:hypothetical protein Bca4012_082704 [Brassica carinata]